jgi:hypothetical protein
MGEAVRCKRGLSCDGPITWRHLVEHPFHPFHELFEQLGLGSSPEEIRSFLQSHAPLPHEVALPDAIFWTPSQAGFLRQALLDDSDWAEVADALNAALRQR